MNESKQVAVIGAGISGLVAIKSLKEEGLHPVCFEKTSRLGGLWHYHEDDTKGVPSVMWSSSFNNSKEPGAFSDFPAKAKSPNFMRHFQVLEMLKDYASHFDLYKHINYNKEVVKVIRAADFEESGKWRVLVKDTETEDIREDTYHGVLICSGHFSVENIPSFPGMKNFKGEIIHTHSIKKVMSFSDKVVCVVGTGSSALDAAAEISHVAKQVYLSIRNPAWVMTRHGPYGYPIDWTIFNYDHLLFQKLLPSSWISKVIEEVYINPRFSHSLYNIKPKRGANDRDPTLNDELPSRIMNGSIMLKKNIKHFAEDGVVFDEEDNEVTAVDSVVLGTGYRWEFPFLDPKDLVSEGKKFHLYKCVFPSQLPHHTLGTIGFLVPLGPGIPCLEMQSRWASRVLSGKCKLPAHSTMMKDIDRQYNQNRKRFGDIDRTFLHVDFIPYLNDLASEIGAKPNLLKLLCTDFWLFVACTFKAFVPYRYRLSGPHKWDGARDAILSAGQRMRAPLQGKGFIKQNAAQSSRKTYALLGILVFVWYLLKKDLLSYDTYLFLKFYAGVIKFLILNLMGIK